MPTMRAIEAEFQNGILKPVQPLLLRPGERVNLVVLRKADPNRWDLQKLAMTNHEDAELSKAGLGDWAKRLDLEDDV